MEISPLFRLLVENCGGQVLWVMFSDYCTKDFIKNDGLKVQWYRHSLAPSYTPSTPSATLPNAVQGAFKKFIA